MTARDRLGISLRHMKSGVVGVLLVILATAVGIALAASTSAFVRAYREQTKQLLNNPSYREVLVDVLVFGEAELTTPVVEVELDKARASLLTVDDMARAAESIPAVDHAYVLQRAKVVTTAALMRLEETKEEEPASREARGRGESAETEESKDLYESKDTAEPGVAEDSSDARDRVKTVELPVDEFPGYATSPDFFTAYGLSAAEGTLFTQEDLDAGNLVIVLGSELAETLFPRGGAVGAQVSLWYQTVTVVGTLESTPLVDSVDLTPYSATAFTPMATLAKAWGERAFVSSMRFATGDSSDAEAAEVQVAAYFEAAHPDTNLMITSRVGQLKDERRTLNRTLVVLVFLTVIGLFIAAINLLNLMLIRIVRHTKGIGIMRSVGWSRRDVFRQFMSESALMCVIGAVIGTAVSPLVYRLLQTTIISDDGFASQTFVLDLLAGAAVGLLFSLAFGLYPAYLAQATDTSSAVRTE